METTPKTVGDALRHTLDGEEVLRTRVGGTALTRLDAINLRNGEQIGGIAIGDRDDGGALLVATTTRVLLAGPRPPTEEFDVRRVEAGADGATLSLRHRVDGSVVREMMVSLRSADQAQLTAARIGELRALASAPPERPPAPYQFRLGGGSDGRRFRGYVYAVLGVAAGLALLGLALPYASLPADAGGPLHHIADNTVARTLGVQIALLPVALAGAVLGSYLRPGRFRGATTVLGGAILGLAIGLIVSDDFSLGALDESGTLVPGTAIHGEPGLGVYMLGAGGLVALVMGMLTLVIPRRLEAAPPAVR